ncbi:MAG: hypothetical protein K8I27_08340 [Planctomycetes bacterium]|nr:hypothetical protein [Planctomycetota bacterium]
MALENYTKGQKIFMVTLVVALAALFTVTGSMIAILGDGGNAAPPDKGTIDGQAVRLMEHQRKLRALGIVTWLDRGSNPTDSEAPEHIYARVPTLSVQEQYGHDWPYNAMRPTETSLLEVWPRYQDQHVWCHTVLAKRAREAGIQPPGKPYIGRVITALMNQSREELNKFDGSKLTKEFETSYGADIAEMLPYFEEAFMVRDYVESLIADERARLDRVARIAAGNNEELKAEYARLKIDYFMGEARQDVLREHYAFRAANRAAGFGAATDGYGYDRFEEAYDKNRDKSLTSDATFSFRIIKAYPEVMVSEGRVEFDRSLLELTYKAVRDEMFKTDADEKANIAERLDRELNRYTTVHSEETRDWGEPEIAKFKADRRPDMLDYLSFFEAEPDLRNALMRRESVQAAQGAIAAFNRYVEEETADRTRKLNAEITTFQREEAVWTGKAQYLEDLRRRFESLETQMHAKLRDVDNKIDESADATPNDEANSRALNNLVDALALELFHIDREQIESLISMAEAVSRPLERDLNDKRAAREEFELEEEHTTDSGQTMSPEEVAARLKQFDLEIQAIEDRMALRDNKVPQVKDFTTDLRRRLAEYELVVRNAKQASGDLTLRRYFLRELLVEIPVELGKLVAEARDEITPQDEIDTLRDRAELIRADYQARQKRIAKDAGDTRKWDLGKILQGRAFTGLKVDDGGDNLTWEQVVRDDRLAFLENVDSARQFLEDPSNPAGSTSDIMAVPGQGYIVLVLGDKTPKYTLSRADAFEKVVTIAAMKRARELTVEALREIRRDMLKRGWDAAMKSAEEKYGEHFEVRTTGYFTDRMDLPEVYSDSDNDVLKLSASPSSTSPDQPFMTRIKDIDPSEGVTKVISEKRNADPLRRAENEQWSYLLARIVDRRAVQRRLTEDNLKDKQWGSSPAEIWRNRHLATSQVVRDLITPASLLADHQIVLYKADEPDANAEEDSEASE